MGVYGVGWLPASVGVRALTPLYTRDLQVKGVGGVGKEGGGGCR